MRKPYCDMQLRLNPPVVGRDSLLQRRRTRRPRQTEKPTKLVPFGRKSPQLTTPQQEPSPRPPLPSELSPSLLPQQHVSKMSCDDVATRVEEAQCSGEHASIEEASLDSAPSWEVSRILHPSPSVFTIGVFGSSAMDFARRTWTLVVNAPPVKTFSVDPVFTKFFQLYNVHGNDARDEKRSFQIEMDIWVYGKKVNVMALVDSGASISVIDKSLVSKERLVVTDYAKCIMQRRYGAITRVYYT